MTDTETAEPTQTTENGSTNLDKIKKKIIRQIEFYFGDYNLMRDTFMKDKMQENDGWFTMDIMLKFKRLASICSEPSTIMEALQDADFGLIEIDTEYHRIRRKPNREVPIDNEDYRAKLKARTVHVQGFQSDESIDDLHEFVSEYGKLEGIQLLRTPDKKFKGSLFATFFKQEKAESFVQAPMVSYKCNEITKMFKSDFYKQLDVEKSAKRKRKTDEKQKEEPKELSGIIMLKVSGITDDTIIHVDIKRVFESKDVRSIRFFDRTEPMGSKGYLVFEDQRTPEELLKILKDNGGTKVTIKSAEVEFSEPTVKEKKNFDELYIQARQKFFSGRDKRKNPRHGKGVGGQQKRRSSQKQQGRKTNFNSDDDDGDDSKQDAEGEKEEPVAKVSKSD